MIGGSGLISTSPPAPPAAWIWRQVVEATPLGRQPTFLIHDRDADYGFDFDERLANLGIRVKNGRSRSNSTLLPTRRQIAILADVRIRPARPAYVRRCGSLGPRSRAREPGPLASAPGRLEHQPASPPPWSRSCSGGLDSPHTELKGLIGRISPRESPLGNRAHPWGVAEARHRGEQPFHPALPMATTAGRATTSGGGPSY